jgi:hypothetical protein
VSCTTHVTLTTLEACKICGSLLDGLGVMASEDKRTDYAAGRLHCAENGLIANRPVKVLMLPAEQRETIAPILRKLRGIRV